MISPGALALLSHTQASKGVHFSGPRNSSDNRIKYIVAIAFAASVFCMAAHVVLNITSPNPDKRVSALYLAIAGIFVVQYFRRRG